MPDHQQSICITARHDLRCPVVQALRCCPHRQSQAILGTAAGKQRNRQTPGLSSATLLALRWCRDVTSERRRIKAVDPNAPGYRLTFWTETRFLAGTKCLVRIPSVPAALLADLV